MGGPTCGGRAIPGADEPAHRRSVVTHVTPVTNGATGAGTGDDSRPDVAVWCIVGLLVAITIALVPRVGVLVDHRAATWIIPWWLLAAGVAAAELLPVHLNLRRHAWSATLIEVPVVLGLVLSTPRSVVIGQVVGSFVARGLVNRQTPPKLAFNVALGALEATAAVGTFRLIAGSEPISRPLVWVAAYVAVLVEGAVSTVGVAAVMRVVTGALPPDVLPNFLLAGVAVPAAGTALSLEVAVVSRADAPATALLVFIVALLAGGYRAYGKLRSRYASLQLLYNFTDVVRAGPDGLDVVGHLLGAVRETLDAEVAELVVVDEDGRFLRHVHGREPRMEVLDRPPPSWEAIQAAGSGLLAPQTGKLPAAARWAQQAGWVDGMVVPLQRDGRAVATLAVANRQSEVATYDRESFRLFEALANHTRIALRNGELIGRLTYEASHDALTRLGNRQQFHRALSRALGARGPGQKIAVALIDLDRFKEINDTLGHQMGDRLLEWLGRTAGAVLPDGLALARLGGDEFVVFVPYEGEKPEATAVVDELLGELWDEPFRVGDVAVDVRASIGVAVAPDDGEDADTLLQRADVAMYCAKSSGGGRSEPYAADRDTNSAERLALAAELRSAIAAGALEVAFQPQVDLRSGRISSAEALVRWSHPKRGPLSPDDFVPLAERTGLIVPLTEFVLQKALEAIVDWRTVGLDLTVAVNVSVRSLGDEHIVRAVERLLELHHLPASCLTLEVTETGIMEDERRNVGVLEALAQLGLRLAVDDFGTGYSSLAYLESLPVHEVKIDKSFVMAMLDSAKKAAIVRSVLILAANLGLDVVAEGVESAEAMEILADLGCTVAQGYHISRPIPAADVADLVERWQRATAEAERSDAAPALRAV